MKGWFRHDRQLVVLSSPLMWSSLNVNAVRDSVIEGGAETAAELVASQELILMLLKVQLDTGYTDRVLRLELRTHNLLQWAT